MDYLGEFSAIQSGNFERARFSGIIAPYKKLSGHPHD
jgi:hypothetical protein